MKVDTEVLRTGLADMGMRSEQVTQAAALCAAGQDEDLARFLKRRRCELMDEMHESQRKVDRLDYLIRQLKTNRKGKDETTG